MWLIWYFCVKVEYNTNIQVKQCVLMHILIRNDQIMRLLEHVCKLEQIWCTFAILFHCRQEAEKFYMYALCLSLQSPSELKCWFKNEPLHKKTNNLHMQKQSRRSAVQLL